MKLNKNNIYVLSRLLSGKAIHGREPRRGPAPRRTLGRTWYLEELEARALLTTFTVTNNSSSGPGSLRQVIQGANSTPGFDLIVFSIGTGLKTIQPTSGLPAITDPVIIDGTTQPGFAGTPIIELKGTGAG